jgi:hypothetical protein
LNTTSASDDFHDSEIGDIYDLYNAVNGVLRDGLLDIKKLDEYGPDDYEVLNVPRLREVWEHSATGCTKCKDIVTALNRMRDAMKSEVSLI